MDDEIIFSGEINYLEEPPPFERASAPARTSGRFGRLPSRPTVPPSVPPSMPPSAPRSAPQSAPPRDRDTIAVARPNSWSGVLLAVAVVVMIMQGWLYLGVRRDLGEMRTRFDQTNTSVDQVWEGAKGLDQDRMRRIAELADSVRAAIEYAQEHVRFLETKDATLGLRLDEADRNVATVLRADVLQRSRLDALERQDRIRSLAFEALSRRAQSQEAYTREVGAAVASLREARGKLDGALAALERQQAASTSAYAQLGRNVESLSGWAEGFRRAGLSSNTVQEKFAFLSDELRRIRIRVDSLRPLPRNVTASDPR